MEQVQHFFNQAGKESNWFDLVLVVVLLVGMIMGRRRGMSEELLPLLQWLIIIYAGGMAYRPFGAMVKQYTGLSLLSGYIIVYLLTAVLVKAAFAFLKRSIGEKMVGSDVFGRLEYPLGMLAGAVHYGAILLFCLSLLNAPYISAAEKKATAKTQKDNFGDISFPTLGSIQDGVFEQSFSGKYIKQYFKEQLMEQQSGTGTDLRQKEGIGRQRERAVDDIIGGKK